MPPEYWRGGLSKLARLHRLTSCLLFPAVLILGACVPAVRPPVERPPVSISTPIRVPPGATPRPTQALADAIQRIALSFDGTVGVAVHDVQAGWTVSVNGAAAFPQQSVSKLWVTLSALDAIDRGAVRLSDEVVIRRKDLTLFHQPIAAQVSENGYRATLRALMEQAMTRSDNTANDAVLRAIGGSKAVRAFLARKQVQGLAFGPGERLLQSRIAGLEWHESYSIGRNFHKAREALPMARREAAIRQYLDTPIDGASPDAIVAALARLRKGDLLSPNSTQLVLSMMAKSKTGPKRLKGGIGEGWAFAHKTGTGQDLGTLSTGYNDVGLLTSPAGRTYAVAVMIASTRQPVWARMQMMQRVSRAVVAHDDQIS